MSVFRCRCWLLIVVVTQCLALGADEVSVSNVPSDLKLKITDLAKERDARLLLFSTLNGYLYGVEQATGKTKWKIKDRAIITVPKEGSDAFNTIFLPDPKDGSLYVITNTKDRIRKLEFSIPELVTSSPCRSTDGILYTGKKKDTWFRIDPRTGDRQQILGWDILHGPTCPVQAPDAIYIGRTEYSLRMVESKQPQRRWNVTFYDYTSAPMSKEDQTRYEMVHFTSSSTGVLITLDRRRGSIMWQTTFDSPIVGVYLLDPDGLISVPFTSVSNQSMLQFVQNLGDDGKSAGNHFQMKLYPTLYIGEHPEGLYALPSYVDQNMVTITNGEEGRVLLLEGPYGKGKLFDTDLEYPLPGQDYPLPHDVVMDTMTFQSVPSQTRIRSIIYLGHYDVPKYSNDKFLLPGQNINHRLITDESRMQQQVRNEALQETRIPWFQMSFSFVLTILTTILAVQFCAKQMWVRSERATTTVETPDGCMRIGKISFDKGQLLGKGCDGTLVYRGEFEGRRVAVKRLLPECFDFADREVALLRESDAHPNVVRYFCTEQDSQFRYIALELCQATLAEYVNQSGVQIQIDELEILQQATLGLAHLHSLNIVHRDIKPQNVLLSVSGPNGRVRAMISDFGLSKKIQLGKVSLSKHSGLMGTDGWIAPEMLNETESITCAVDLFSLGCLFYYVLSAGGHPFGDALHRQANILSGDWSMNTFRSTPDKIELSMTLLSVMISPQPNERPDCRAVLNHPIFWKTQAVLAFLQDVSDRVEKSPAYDPVLLALEENSECVVRGDWQHHIDDEVSSDLRKYRNYRGNSLRDLLRALRNKKHHYHDLTKESQRKLGDIPNEFTAYWTLRFPLLVPHTWIAMQMLHNEDNFRQYYTTFKFPKTVLKYRTRVADDAATPKLCIVTPQSDPTLSCAASQNVGLYRLSPQSTSGCVRNSNRTQQQRRKNHVFRKHSTRAQHAPHDAVYAERPVWVLHNTKNSQL